MRLQGSLRGRLRNKAAPEMKREPLMCFTARTQLVHPSALYCVGIISCVKPIVLSDRSEGVSPLGEVCVQTPLLAWLSINSNSSVCKGYCMGASETKAAPEMTREPLICFTARTELLICFTGRTQLAHPNAIYCVGIISCVKPIVLSERNEGVSGGNH